jgi:hypothetical protein
MAKWTQPGLLEVETQVVEIAKGPPERWTEDMKDLESKAAGDSPFIRLFLPSAAKLAAAEQRRLAYQRSAVVALAAERYRLARGQYPATPDELVKAGLLKAVPADPYDGKTIRFAKSDGGLVVYSVGVDGTDNGGILNRQRMTDKGVDIGFELFAPDRRKRE